MLDLTRADMAALIWFAVAWFGYSFVVDRARFGANSLNARMVGFRRRWMRSMLARDNRIVDTQINMQLQQGAGFFASATTKSNVEARRPSRKDFSALTWRQAPQATRASAKPVSPRKASQKPDGAGRGSGEVGAGPRAGWNGKGKWVMRVACAGSQALRASRRSS